MSTNANVNPRDCSKNHNAIAKRHISKAIQINVIKEDYLLNQGNGAKIVGIISLSLPEEMLKKLDSILGEEHSATRSEIVRQAVRNYILEYNKLDKIKGNITATITVLYGKTEKNDELFQLQHEFGDMITAYLHSHISEKNCLEVLVVKGPSKRLKNLIDGLKAHKPVKQVKFAIMSSEDEPA
jgi:CopG family nickel-responsive transcriptional regulator